MADARIAAQAPALEALGDRALILRFGDRIDGALNHAVQHAARVLQTAALPGVEEIVPAYASITLHYAPAAFAATAASPFAVLGARVQDALRAANIATATLARVVEIPVCYGGPFGIDLDAVAAHAGLAPEAVIAQHAAAHYQVAMLGFAPGFPYLLGLPQVLHTPRRSSPRTHVPAGSVAIGGAQTGIYPRELPGGWQLIGRTPVCLFDIASPVPTLLAPGDTVRFVPIDRAAFDAWPAQAQAQER